MSSDDESPESVTFESSKKAAFSKSHLEKQERARPTENERRRKQREELYRQQKESKKLDLNILKELNNKNLENEIDNPELKSNPIENEQSSEKIVYSSDDDPDDNDSGINVQVQKITSKKQDELYLKAMNFRKNMLYGKRIKRISAKDKKNFNKLRAKRKKANNI